MWLSRFTSNEFRKWRSDLLMKTKEKLEHIKYQLDERLNKRLKNRINI